MIDEGTKARALMRYTRMGYSIEKLMWITGYSEAEIKRLLALAASLWDEA